MERKFFGLTMADVMRLAYQLAVRNGIKNQFCKRNEKAGRKWLKNFLRRHPQISVRTPEGLPLSKARGFTPESAHSFLIYEPAMDTTEHNPARLYNCDETGFTIVQHKHTTILGLKGKRQISSLQSAAHGSLVTVVNCMSPTGHVCLPLFVFPRKKIKQELMNGTPPGSIHACHPSGWIQREIFSQWFLHFITHTKPTKEDPVILVLDGHYSNTRNLEVINLARDNHLPQTSQQPQNATLGYSFHGAPENILLTRN